MGILASRKVTGRDQEALATSLYAAQRRLVTRVCFVDIER